MSRLTTVILLLVAACDRSRAGRDLPLLQPVTVLGSSDGGEGALSSHPLVTRQLSTGHYLVTTPWGTSAELARLYDASGQFVRSLGRLGAGPGEYRWPEFAFRSADSTLIYDSDGSRLTVLRGADSVVRAQPWMFRPYTFIELSDGSFVLSTGAWVAGRVLEHVARSGDRLLAFGDSMSRQGNDPHYRVLAWTGGRGFWSALPTHRLLLERWAAPGVRVETHDLAPKWFPPSTGPQDPTPTNPPSPTVIGFWADSADALWVIVQVADRDWARGLGPAQTAEGRTYYPVDDRNAVFDTIVAQYDPATRDFLFTHRLDLAVTQVVEPWILVSTTQSLDGWLQAHLWRLRPPSGGGSL